MDQFNAPQSGGALKITQYAVFIVYQVEIILAASD